MEGWQSGLARDVFIAYSPLSGWRHPGGIGWLSIAGEYNLMAAHRNSGKTVAEILVNKRGSIRQAPLEKRSPSWDDIGGMIWEEVALRAEADEPGFRTIKKLLSERRFDK